MTDEEQTVAEVMAAMPMGPLNEKMGVVLVEVTADRVTATMPVEGNQQPYGLLHGGASVVLAETPRLDRLGDPRLPDGQGRGRRRHQRHPPPLRDLGPGHRRRDAGAPRPSSACWEVVISDERGKRVCTSRITCALIPQGQRRDVTDRPGGRLGARRLGAPHRAARGEHPGELRPSPADAAAAGRWAVSRARTAAVGAAR